MVVFLGIMEYINHQKLIYSIPVRIHVNGTRGKSSVTRLIAAGMREGGLKTITKVTGTFPRLILEDGTETHIYRKAGANIIEQLSIVKFAAKRKADALVMECMALQPQYQWITENKMIHATIGVITNVRIDHTDVMGHTLDEIAESLGKTIPRNAHLFTAERVVNQKLITLSTKKRTEIHFANPETVSKEEMKKFSYIEHNENVALALEVCKFLNIDRQTALRGMYKAIPDSGVLKRFTVKEKEKEINFYNAFAANDPESTLMIWNLIDENGGFADKRIILLNTRHDRLYRAKDLIEMITKHIGNGVDHLLLMGQSTDMVANMAHAKGFDTYKIVNMGWVEPEKIFEEILNLTLSTSTVVAMGNMGGKGAATVSYFENRSIN